jgi:hypothetical protein
MSQHSNAKTKTPQGKPSDSQRGGNGLKDVIRETEVTGQIEDKYLDDNDQPDDNVNIRHKNRNTDKGREDQGKSDLLL